MPNCKDINVSNLKLLALVYGAIGTGKTRLLDTCPKPCYVFSTDPRGVVTLHGKDVEYDEYSDTILNGVLKQSAWKLIFDKVTSEAFTKSCPYATIAFDSVTTLQTSMANQIMKDANRKFLEWKDWGTVVTMMEDFIVRLGNLPCHVIMTAHESLEKDDVEGSMKICPAFMGKKLPQEIGAFFSEVYRMAVVREKDGSLKYVMHTQRGPNFDAKTRLGGLLPVEEPNITRILEKVRS